MNNKKLMDSSAETHREGRREIGLPPSPQRSPRGDAHFLITGRTLGKNPDFPHRGKIGPVFPQCGKTFSIAWKMRQKNFHGVENPENRACSGHTTCFLRAACHEPVSGANASNGGERGIRTPVPLARDPVFKTGALSHSAISPWLGGTIARGARGVQGVRVQGSEVRRRPVSSPGFRLTLFLIFLVVFRLVF